MEKPESVPKVAVSACLLGQNVRYNGGHCNFALFDRLNDFIEKVSFCPEVGIGLGTPRPTIRLVDSPLGIRIIEPKSGKDYTQKMAEWSELQSDSLINQKISGIVFKKGSPSCGLERVKVYSENNHPQKNGTGLFSMIFTTLYPHIPAIEEGRLSEPIQAENFLARVAMMDLWWKNEERGWTIFNLQQFHSEHKLLLQSRSPKSTRILGNLLAVNPENKSIGELALEYITMAQEYMGHNVEKRYVAAALRRAVGRLPKDLPKSQRAYLHTWIDYYLKGLVPRIASMALIQQAYEMSGSESLPWKHLFEPFNVVSGVMAKV
jgi:uncharacterized protein YbbK (DUF523 family)/uncharacterized protein YbgA (DUF1722 family)